MGGLKLVLVVLLSVTAVQAFPWWSDIGATHGVKAAPVSLAQLGRRDTESDLNKGFPWRSLAQNDELGDDKLRLRSRKLPPFEVLDANHDDVLSQDEWTGYVTKLRQKAVGIISQGSDAVAREYLLDIARFHYDNLDSCIQTELVELSSTNFTDITTELQHRCYIKFRYSLFAGPPPYELVSNSAPTVTAHEMETWFTVQIDIARHDLTEGRVFGLTDKDELHLEQLVACAHTKLGPWDESELNRNQFYDALTEIVVCA